MLKIHGTPQEILIMNSFEEDCAAYLWDKFRNPVFASDSGLDNRTVKENVARLAEEYDTLPRPVAKGKIFRFIMENIQIDVNPHDYFPGFGCWDRNDRPAGPAIARWDHEVNQRLDCEEEWNRGNRTGCFAIWKDFDHSVPDWNALLTLGFPGILARIRKYRLQHEKNGTLSGSGAAFFDGLEITWEAILLMTERLRDFARTRAGGNARVLAEAECLDSLVHGKPRNFYEVLQMIYLYFMYSEHVDRMQVRSLGNLDQMLLPYFEQDLADGRFSEEEMRRMLDHFMMQWGSINNYWGQPFYLGGTRPDGESAINRMSYLILEEFEKLRIPTPKIQLKIAENTPDAFLEKALSMVRSYNASLVFVGEESYRRAGMGLGFTAEEMRTCDIKGCYEFGIRGGSTNTGVGYVNLLKGIELVLNNGVDPVSGEMVGLRTGEAETLAGFDDFYRAYLLQQDFLEKTAMRIVDSFEPYLHEINPAQVYSGTIEHSLETVKDAFSNGSRYNLTDLLHTGIGTAVDSLMAVKRFVYEKKEISLPDLRDALNRNWKGFESLRRRILLDPVKYGNGNPEADFYAETIARFLTAGVNRRANARGGFYMASIHCAKQYFEQGKKTGATPDGRAAGEEMSKNASPTMGMDTNGVTALIRSATTMDSAIFPGDFPLDLMLHPASVQGEDGMQAMKSLVRTYFRRHGMAVHFNIFDPETLADAQKHPEKYQNLQVRVCGWNTRFNDMCKAEQDEYIKRARNLGD